MNPGRLLTSRARVKALFEKMRRSNRGASEQPVVRRGARARLAASAAARGHAILLLTQFAVLLARRWKLFFRDRGQLALQVALLFGFPILVVIFALDGLPQIKNSRRRH